MRVACYQDTGPVGLRDWLPVGCASKLAEDTAHSYKGDRDHLGGGRQQEGHSREWEGEVPGHWLLSALLCCALAQDALSLVSTAL